jgi:hypothetical protein
MVGMVPSAAQCWREALSPVGSERGIRIHRVLLIGCWLLEGQQRNGPFLTGKWVVSPPPWQRAFLRPSLMRGLGFIRPSRYPLPSRCFLPITYCTNGCPNLSIHIFFPS